MQKEGDSMTDIRANTEKVINTSLLLRPQMTLALESGFLGFVFVQREEEEGDLCLTLC